MQPLECVTQAGAKSVSTNPSTTAARPRTMVQAEGMTATSGGTGAATARRFTSFGQRTGITISTENRGEFRQ